MSIGMCRSLVNEYPHICFQHVDIEGGVTSGTACLLAQALIQLIYRSFLKSDDVVWSNEPEMVLRDDKWFIPRIKSDQALNDQLNASKMKIQTQKELERDTIEIQQRRNRFVIVEPVPSLPPSSSSPHVEVTVTHSLLWPFNMGTNSSAYLCYGYTDSEPRTRVLAISATNRSKVSVPSFFVWDMSSNNTEAAILLRKTAFTITAERLLSDVDSGATVLVHEADEFMGTAIQWKAAELGLTVVLTTSDREKAKSNGVVFVHALAPERLVKKIVPQSTSLVIDLSGNDYSAISSPLQRYLTSRCKFFQLQDIIGSASQGVQDPLIHGIRDASRSSLKIAQDGLLLKPSELAKNTMSVRNYATVVDFASDNTISAVVQPLRDDQLFRSDKTYLLIGCNGGLGKALCRWMVSSGVRHLALTTRNVATVDKVWLEELRLQGAEINLYQADVSDKDALQQAYYQIVQEMPPICGAANAALLLSDRAFSGLKVDDFLKVFGPKVKGTQNLHELLMDQKLDFFIMFSSLASVVGNRGQANYAAANLFMSAIAEQRRTKGLAASVMHIGMVLGVGYVSSTGAYEATLRSLNYLAISETDLLNMFSQAILVGQPDSAHAPELITGLNRYSLEPDVHKYFWHDDMRFSHYTVEEEHQERSSTTKISILHRLAETKDPSAVLAIIVEEFCTKLERLLQADNGSVKASQSLLGLGVDSLVSSEIRSWFLKEVDVDIPVLEILNTASITELCSTVISNLPTVSGQATREKSEVTKEAIKSLDAVVTLTAASSALPTENEPFTLRNSPNSTQVTSEADREEYTSICADVERSGPLSFAQERLWFLQQFLQNPCTYNVTMHYRISGPLQLKDLERAFQQVIQRHESLRTSFYIDTETDLPRQGVYRQSSFQLVQKNSSTAKTEYEIMKNTKYNLEQGDVLRAVVVANADDEHELIFGFHHIALDGYSAQIMVRDLAKAYTGQALPPKRQDYLDFAIAQKVASFPSDTIRYWKAEYENLPPTLPLLNFAESKMRVPLTDYTTIGYERALSAEQGASIKAAARNLGVTPFHIHLTALQAVLYDLTSSKDVCIGITDANKNDAAHMDTVGFFVNVLPIRLHSSASQTLADLASNAKAKADNALAHSQIPFDVLLDELKLPRSTAHSPLFQVVLNYKMGSTQKVPLADCQAQLVAFKDADNPYDLTFDIEVYNDGSTSVSIKTQQYLYTQSELEFAMDTYVNVLNLFSEHRTQTLGQLCKPTTGQIQKALSLGKGEQIPSPRLETLSHYFEDWVNKQPETTALRTDDGKVISYLQLNALVSQIAVRLVDMGVEQGSRVCVYCEPSLYIFAILMAIAKSGGVYVPLDTQNPIKRLQLIVDDCQPEVLLIDDSTKDMAPELKTTTKFVNVYGMKPGLLDAPQFENRARGTGMGYIYYTSGTTGVPQGVALTHATLVHHIDGLIHFYNLGRGRMLQQAPLGFDMSLTQMSIIAVLGGSLIVASSETRKDPMQIAQLMVAESKCVDWEFALLSGEAFRAHVPLEFKRLNLKNLQLYNGYGPTEITINSSSGLDELGDSAPHGTRNPSIGFTLPNYSTYIVDEDMQLVRPGMAGEENLTKARFIPNPFASPDYVACGWTRMYRTGDKARFLPDGRIVFLGRIAGDSQIKLRGFRIELEDIANTIVKAADGIISEAAVSLREGVSGDGDSAYLVAFAIISQTNRPSDVKAYLKQLLKDLSLPRYMIPARIVPIDRLPMNASGKLDQYALDALSVPLETDTSGETLTETQDRLKLEWLKVLPPVGADATIGPDTDFFSAGGNSLRIVTLREHIGREFGVTISVFDLFQTSTLGEMAAKIDDLLASQITEGLQVALTGSTGFLGLSILKSLLEDRRVSKVHCLAIRSSFKKRDTVFSSPRVACYQGDLSLPCLGLTEDQFDLLARTADRIIHNGADVSFLKTYQSLRRSNVGSVKELARMAMRRKIPLHFVSTGGVVNLTGQDGLPEVSIADAKPPTDGSQGYVVSKWASEHILEEYAERHSLPVWIHRPANITGANAPSADLMQNIFHYSLKTASLPDLTSWTGFFDFVPVETVARDIASSIHEAGTDKVVFRYHCGTQKISIDDLPAHLETELGRTIEMVDVEDWLDLAKNIGLDGVTAALVEKTLKQGGGIIPWLQKGEE
ncbi:hypothetical protein HG530_008490 [Fusarium avenaceum]|nr:hypothetical protein HG530_008490 [Fusarium avenaceum]